MYQLHEKKKAAICFKHFNNRNYSVFCSLKREIRIGVLAFSTLTFANMNSISAQTTDKHSEQQKMEVELDGVEVTGSRVPVTLAQSARIVTVLSRKEIEAAPAQSVNDLLKYAVGVDVRQRGAYGMQTDIGIRGGTFDQIAILLNGVNISSPQTGHNASTFPVDISDIERIEIIEGPAGRAIGNASLMGAINIVTHMTARKKSAQLHAEAGSYGLWGGGASIGAHRGEWANQLSGSYRQSDGTVENSNFRDRKFFYQGHYKEEAYKISWQAGLEHKDYGANTFYSAKYPNQYEHLNNMFASVQGETLGKFHLCPTLYTTHSTDRFELIKGDENLVPYNYHRTNVYGLNVNSYLQSAFGKTALGGEIRLEDIVSTNLGEPLNEPIDISGTNRQYTKGLSRTNVSLHAEHNLYAGKFSFSAGAMAVYNTGLDHSFHFYPGADVSYRMNENWKFFTSWNTSMRMPTFTELYYSSNATHQGNSHLKQEEMQAFEVGSQFRNSYLRATASVFHHRGKNLIDWVMATDETIWRSVNHTHINSTGAEMNMQLDLQYLLGVNQPLQNLSLAYAYTYQDRAEENGYTSEYALDYVRHKFVAGLTHKLFLPNLSAGWSFRWQEREGSYDEYIYAASGITKGSHVNYQPYGLLDLRISYVCPRWQVFTEGNNLTCKRYVDYGNVRQAGFTFRAGGSIKF